MDKRFALIIILAVGLIHRLAIYFFYQNELNILIGLNDKFLGMHYLHASALGEHFLNSIKLLQQAPVLPNIIAAIGIKLFGFPYGLGNFFVLLQGAISIFTSCLIFLSLDKLNIQRPLAVITSLLFLLSTDLLLFEYSVIGQAVHEALAMFLLSAVLYFWIDIERDSKTIKFLILGIIAALLILSRSYFFIFSIPLIALLLLKKISFKKIVVTLIPILILQGAWSLKNYQVHNYISPQTSTYSGFNLQHALSMTGHEEDFYNYLKENDDNCPPWLQKATDEQGLIFFWLAKIYQYIPAELIQSDKNKLGEIGSYNSNIANSETIRIISKCYQQAWLPFALKNPDIMFDVFQKSYRKFWQPIRNYSRLYVALFYPRTAHNLLGDKGSHSFNDGDSIHSVYIMQASLAKNINGKQPIEKTENTKASTWTLSASSFFMLYLNLFTVHLIIPALLITSLIKKDQDTTRNLFAFFILFGFCAVLTSLGEYGENTRFRLAVEPLIWVFTVFSLQTIYLKSKSAKEPLTTDAND